MNCNRAGTAFLCGLIAIWPAIFAGCNMPAQGGMNYDPEKDESEWVRGAKRPPSARTLLAMARILIAQGRDQKGQFVLDKIVQEYPQCSEAYVELAELHMRHRRVDVAITTLQQGLMNARNDPVLLNDLGVCWIFRTQYNAAETVFRQAAAAAPGNTRYQGNLAMAIAMQGRYEEALSIYTKILAQSDAHTNIAVIAQSRNDTLRAKRECAIAEELRRREMAPPEETKDCAQSTPRKKDK
ncbi:MAG: tetratricopeptide repeat protein [Planctomycetaceae bacterium]|nr:tetratricopeptide repeat protein [Planctomycetaceae bacterium]